MSLASNPHMPGVILSGNSFRKTGMKGNAIVRHLKNEIRKT